MFITIIAIILFFSWLLYTCIRKVWFDKKIFTEDEKDYNILIDKSYNKAKDSFVYKIRAMRKRNTWDYEKYVNRIYERVNLNIEIIDFKEIDDYYYDSHIRDFARNFNQETKIRLEIWNGTNDSLDENTIYKLKSFLFKLYKFKIIRTDIVGYGYPYNSLLIGGGA